MNFKLKVTTAWNLGLSSLFRYFSYQFCIQIGFNPVKRLKQDPIEGLLFRSVSSISSDNSIPEYQFSPFSWMPKQNVTDIKWDQSVLTKERFSTMEKPWFRLTDFDSDVGDIKGIWEASRFDWTLGLACDHLNGSEKAIKELNTTIQDWIKHNPPYLGPNWKCGQEASIRVMHLAFTAKLLGQIKQPESALLELISAHLQRIAPTISYAVAQDNNHGTSEAAALFIGGSWLALNGLQKGVRWQKMGLKWLENRALRLIEKDGSFSQYSMTYHRVMLDTYVMAELWRQELNLPSFSEKLYTRLQAATNWLYQMTQVQNGDAPNLGANDGARFLPLTNTDYRDFRPSVQLASVLFLKAAAWRDTGEYDKPLTLLGLVKPKSSLSMPNSFHFANGGYCGLRNQAGAFALFNYSNFRFRPSQCDSLHVDFWLNGINLLRDGGTFSYNAGQEYIDYYGGVKSHNVIAFDEHEQMPRISRFLLGAWLKAKNVRWDEQRLTAQAGYKDYLGCEHTRKVTLEEKILIVKDTIKGFSNKAVLRWRLNPDNWVVQGKLITNGYHKIKIITDTKIARLEIVEGRESRYYYQETPIPVLEIEVSSCGVITTEYHFHS